MTTNKIYPQTLSEELSSRKNNSYYPIERDLVFLVQDILQREKGMMIWSNPSASSPSSVAKSLREIQDDWAWVVTWFLAWVKQ